MSEYFILANLDREEYVDPSEFIPDEQVETSKDVATVAAIDHIDWANGISSWIAPYLLTDEGSAPLDDIYGDYCGRWSENKVTLIGDGTEKHDTIVNEWRSISQPLYDEVNGCESEIPPGSL